MAAHVFVATTATPPSGENAAGGAQSTLSSNILSTPGTLRSAVASKDFTLPPTTRGRAITASHARQSHIVSVATFLKHKLKDTEVTYAEPAKRLRKHGLKGNRSVDHKQAGARHVPSSLRVLRRLYWKAVR